MLNNHFPSDGNPLKGPEPEKTFFFDTPAIVSTSTTGVQPFPANGYNTIYNPGMPQPYWKEVPDPGHWGQSLYSNPGDMAVAMAKKLKPLSTVDPANDIHIEWGRDGSEARSYILLNIRGVTVRLHVHDKPMHGEPGDIHDIYLNEVTEDKDG